MPSAAIPFIPHAYAECVYAWFRAFQFPRNTGGPVPVQEILEAVKGGGWVVVSGVVLVVVVIVLALVFAPLVYISVLRGGPTHDRLLDLIRLFTKPRRK